MTKWKKFKEMNPLSEEHFVALVQTVTVIRDHETWDSIFSQDRSLWLSLMNDELKDQNKFMHERLDDDSFGDVVMLEELQHHHE